jgi:hypothetical protein
VFPLCASSLSVNTVGHLIWLPWPPFNSSKSVGFGMLNILLAT